MSAYFSAKFLSTNFNDFFLIFQELGSQNFFERENILDANFCLGLKLLCLIWHHCMKRIWERIGFGSNLRNRVGFHVRRNFGIPIPEKLNKSCYSLLTKISRKNRQTFPGPRLFTFNIIGISRKKLRSTQLF